MGKDGEYVLTGGAATLLDCSPDNVRYLERTGKLRAMRVNGVRVFLRDDVERLGRFRNLRRKEARRAAW
jgi:DNA-binding transcriptional MerR regulator